MFRKISPKEYCTVTITEFYREASAFGSVLVYILDHIRSYSKTNKKYEETQLVSQSAGLHKWQVGQTD